jgi:hypothetical protein
MGWTWTPRDVGIDPRDYGDGQAPVKDPVSGRFVPGEPGGGQGVTNPQYGVEPPGPGERFVGLVWIDATGQGIRPDGSRP